MLTTPTGSIVVVGCSHPGIERILAAAIADGVPVRARLRAPPRWPLPTRCSFPGHRLRSQWRITKIAPGHCTGEPAFAALQKEFGDDYIYAGLGERITRDPTGDGNQRGSRHLGRRAPKPANQTRIWPCESEGRDWPG